MRITGRRTSWLASWLVGLLLVTQFAAAAHGCPSWIQQAGALIASAQIASAPMPGCEHMAEGPAAAEHPTLCMAHCQPDAQSVSASDAPDLSAQPVLFSVLDWTPASQRSPRLAGHAPLVRSGAAPPGSPPLYLSLRVLRI
jgi:hypothetical protein